MSILPDRIVKKVILSFSSLIILYFLTQCFWNKMVELVDVKRHKKFFQLSRNDYRRKPNDSFSSMRDYFAGKIPRKTMKSSLVAVSVNCEHFHSKKLSLWRKAGIVYEILMQNI